MHVLAIILLFIKIILLRPPSKTIIVFSYNHFAKRIVNRMGSVLPCMQLEFRDRMSDQQCEWSDIIIIAINI